MEETHMRAKANEQGGRMTPGAPGSDDVRILVVNGDDFGQSQGINLGILEAHERGILTSASLMVRGEAATEAAGVVRTHPALGIGLHIDVGEWVFEDGKWRALYDRVPDRAAGPLAAEVHAQVRIFERMIGRPPTHIDSHQHVHRWGPLSGIVKDLAGRLKVPLRSRTPTVAYRGEFYGQSGKGEPCREEITVEALTRLIRALQPGVTEIGCHPAARLDFASPYRAERRLELDALCDPSVREAIESENIRLCSFPEAAWVYEPRTTT
jgi:predicted glycoside hydrolase/deacetylase ChbG (UPF0249 family)